MSSFRSHPSGKPHIITPPTGASGGSLARARSDNTARTGAVIRTLTRKERNKLRTLQNELLWQNFIKRVEKMNPDMDIDFETIDRTLEPEEALMELRRKDPQINIGLKDTDATAEFREFLDEFGIENQRVQSLVAMADPPLTEQELGELSYALNGRTEHAMKMDSKLKAPITNDVRRYAKAPNRYDIKTVDDIKRK